MWTSCVSTLRTSRPTGAPVVRPSSRPLTTSTRSVSLRGRVELALAGAALVQLVLDHRHVQLDARRHAVDDGQQRPAPAALLRRRVPAVRLAAGRDLKYSAKCIAKHAMSPMSSSRWDCQHAEPSSSPGKARKVGTAPDLANSLPIVTVPLFEPAARSARAPGHQAREMGTGSQWRVAVRRCRPDRHSADMRAARARNRA